MPNEDDDQLDGCELDFAADAVDDNTAALLPLFPTGEADEARAAEWRALFEGQAG